MGRRLVRSFGVFASVTASVMAAVACSSDYGVTSNPVIDDRRDAGARDGAADASATGDASADAAAPKPWLLYTNYGNNGESWGPPIELGAYFGSDPSAPPAYGIAAAAYVTSMDRLLVVTEAGKVHVRKGAKWLAPRASDDVFSTMRGVRPRALWHLPLTDGGASSCTLLFTATPNAYQFRYDSEDLATPLGGAIPLTDGDGGSSPRQVSTPARWDYETVLDPTGMARPWAVLTVAYGSEIWKLDTDLVWTRTPVGSFAMLTKPGAPPVDRIREAFYDSAARNLHMIVTPP